MIKKFASRAGEISYVTQGEGPLNFLLVHNSGGSHEMMGYTADHFSKKGKTLTPDLLGHGESSKPKMEYTLNVFAESLFELCEFEKWHQIVFIGLNYGADIGIVMAEMASSLISHLVLLEPPIFMESWIVKVVEDAIRDLENGKKELAEETVNSVIMKASPHETEISLNAIKKTPPFVKSSTFKNLLLWDKEHSFRCPIPTLLIQSSHPFCKEEKARTVFSKLDVGRVVGSGAWINLEVPTQVHSMIDRFLELYY